MLVECGKQGKQALLFVNKKKQKNFDSFGVWRGGGRQGVDAGFRRHDGQGGLRREYRAY
jgi:hypothetical protein